MDQSAKGLDDVDEFTSQWHEMFFYSAKDANNCALRFMQPPWHVGISNLEEGIWVVTARR